MEIGNECVLFLYRMNNNPQVRYAMFNLIEGTVRFAGGIEFSLRAGNARYNRGPDTVQIPILNRFWSVNLLTGDIEAQIRIEGLNYPLIYFGDTNRNRIERDHLYYNNNPLLTFSTRIFHYGQDFLPLSRNGVRTFGDLRVIDDRFVLFRANNRISFVLIDSRSVRMYVLGDNRRSYRILRDGTYSLLPSSQISLENGFVVDLMSGDILRFNAVVIFNLEFTSRRWNTRWSRI